jgi:RNA polymerase sigma-70 factor (ECF subfamily)
VAASPTTSGPLLSFRQVATVPVTANARLSAQSWGTAVEMKCTYLGQQTGEEPRRYTLVAEDRSSNSFPIGDWLVVSGKEVTIRSSTAIPRDQLRSLRVLSPSGRTLLELDL